jgi:hypothetical protein
MQLMENGMFTLIHTSFIESKNKMALALRFQNPLTGSRYIFRCGLTREQQSDLDDLASYSRRVEDFRRSIELSTNI